MSMKKIICFLKKIWIGLWVELKDWHTFLLFLAIVVVVGATVWVPILLGIITKNKYWYGIAATVEAIWLGPVPFIPICIGITIGLKKTFKTIRNKANKVGTKNIKKRLEGKK